MLTFSSPIIINGGNFLTYGDALLSRQTLYQTPQISENTKKEAVAVSPDGGIYISLYTDNRVGNFESSSTGIDPIFSLQKLNSDGTRNTIFYNNVLSSGFAGLVELSYRSSYDLLFAQNDGKIIVAAGIGVGPRFNSDGTVDSSFRVATMDTNGSAIKMAQQSDGKVIIVGDFTTYSGSSSPGIVRINSDNTVDTSFKTGGGFTGSSYVRVYDVKIQSDGKIVCAGIFSFYSGSTKDYGGAIRLNSGGDIDTSFDPGTSFGGTGASLINDYPITVQVNSNGSLTFAGNFRKYQNQSGSVIRTLSDGTIDTSFKSGSIAPGQALDSVIESNDKVTLIGSFTSYSGSSATYIVRINPDGTLDSTFKYGEGFSGGLPYNIAKDSNDNFYVAGYFSEYSGSSRGLYDGVIKINKSGSIDTSFSPPMALRNDLVVITGTGYPQSSWWQYFPIKKIISSSLGGYYIVGNFNRIGGNKQEFPCIVKLNPNLTISSSIDYSDCFDTDLTQNPFDIVEQNDNKVILAGNFTSYKNSGTNRIVRINPDFSKDNTFITGSGFNNLVYALAIDSATQKIYAGGDFTSYSGSAVNRIVRINPDGTRDTSFSIGTGFNDTVVKIVPQTDGKILVAGSFATFNGNSSAGIIRLNSDGTYDTTFNTNGGTSLAGIIRDIILESDGKVLLCGSFTTYSGSSYCSDVVLVDSSGSIDTSFNSGTGLSNGFFLSAIKAPDGSYILGTSIDNDGVSTNYSGSQFQSAYSVGPIKINPNGTLNQSFNCPLFAEITEYQEATVKSMVFDSDGGLLIGGSFFWVSGSYQYNIAKINLENGFPWYTQI